MNPNLQKRWAPYESLMPFTSLQTKLRLPIELIREEIEHLVPSIELGTDGPVIKSVYFATQRYLCEVRIGAAIEDIDFALIQSITNYRVTFGHHEVMKEPASEPAQSSGSAGSAQQSEKIIYETAEVILRHTAATDGLISRLTYAGTNRERWFELVTAAFPLTLLAKGA